MGGWVITQTTSGLTSCWPQGSLPLPLPQGPQTVHSPWTPFSPHFWASALASVSFTSITAPEARGWRERQGRVCLRASSWLFLQVLHTDSAPSYSFLLPLCNLYLQFFPGPLFCCCYPPPLLPTSFVTVIFLGTFQALGPPLLFWDAMFFLAPGCDHMPLPLPPAVFCSHPSSLTG